MSMTEDNIGAALRDYALDQITHADLQLARAGAWQHGGVHLARKAIARLRACVELLHESPQAPREMERHLRRFAHGLSLLRDTQAALATARSLLKHNGKLAGTWRELARELKQRRDRVLGMALADDPGFASHRAQLAEMRAALSHVAWTRMPAADLQRALERADKRVRRARSLAAGTRAREPRHRLRRRSRHLLLQASLLREIARDAKRPVAASAARAAPRTVLGKSLKRKPRKRLVDRLGWEQDLHVLRQALPARATTASSRRAIAALGRELARAQAATNKLIG